MNMLEKALAKEKKVVKPSEKKNIPKENEKNSIINKQSKPSEPYIRTTNKPEVKQKETKIKNDIVRFDWDYLNENGFIRIDEAHNRIAEEYRSIKRPLVTNALGSRKRDIKNANLILITSSIPGEGKTFTSINLALSIAAELDKSVLLVDADVAKPSVSRVLGIKSKVGLIDYLESDELEIEDIMLETEVSGLRIIPAGKSHKFSTELLASDKMIELSNQLSKRYSNRMVIFDTPPLLATTQAEVLATQMGQIILVVAAETTPQQFVMESVEKLKNCSDVVLTLLNKAQRNLNVGYYGYGQY